MDESAVPAGPAGAWNPRKHGDPFSCSSRCRGAPREARRLRRAVAQSQGPRRPWIPSLGQG
eukprot:3855906-Alexandrium_andersonii.AAC.1